MTVPPGRARQPFRPPLFSPSHRGASWQAITRRDPTSPGRSAHCRRYTGDRRSPKPFGRITQDTRVILASFFGPICGDDHPCISRYARLADCSVLGDGGAQIGTFCIRRVPVGRWDRPRLLPSPHSGPCCQSSLSVGLVKLMRTDRLPGRTYSQASCWRRALLPGMACRPLRPVGRPWLRKSARAGQAAARGSRGNR